MLTQPQSFTVNMPNPLTPDEIARRTNSHYSDEYARALGYKRATVGGFIMGHIMLRLAEFWGPVWFERGEFHARHRQPVYAGDDVQVLFSPTRDEDGVTKSDYQAINPDGVVGVVGWAGLRSTETVPSLSDFPFTQMRSVPLKIIEGEKIVGERLASLVINDPQHRVQTPSYTEYKAGIYQGEGEVWMLPAALRSDHPDLPEKGLVPWVMGGGLQRPDLDHAGTNIQALTEGHWQFFSLASVNDQLTTHTRISGAFERKGSKYFQIETLVVADNRTPIVSVKLTRLMHLMREQA